MLKDLHLQGLNAAKRLLLAMLLLAAVGFYHARAAENETAFSQYLMQWLSQPELKFNNTSIAPETMRSFYASQQYKAFWADDSGLTKRAEQALAVIAKADNHGLNSEIYSVNVIHRIAAFNRGDADQRMRVRLSLEVMMSQAIMDYAADMNGGTVRPQWNTGKPGLSKEDQVALLTQAAATQDTASYLAAMAPASPDYLALQRSYQHYQAIAEKGGWPEFAVGKTIKPGMSDPRLASLQQILTLTGDLSGSTASTAYDEALVEAVKSFQSRHGIEADGTLGNVTQQALAVPVGKRIEQMAMTLERMRWMPRDFGSRYVLVNIPGYELRGVNGQEKIAMDVIVGKPNSKTPMFSKEITDVVLNPSWGVPAKIAVNEMLPKIRKNPNYLSRAGYQVTSNGQLVNPDDVDWESVGHGNFNYSFRQPPGDGNALGKVKFTIPDSDNIYLHDTSQRGLFVKADRSLSHGCVRLADPKAMTEFVLKGEGWSADKITSAYKSSASRTVSITPMPVHLVYWTSWVDEAGKPHFSRDIYGLDKSLLAAMAIKPVEDKVVKVAMN